MFRPKNISFLRNVKKRDDLNFYATQAPKYLSAKEVIEKQLRAEIQPPKAKKWSKTAVLEALNENVKFCVRPHYMALQSPQYWGNYEKNSSKYIARMNGIKAANYVISNQREIFEHDWDADNIDPWLRINPDEQFPDDPLQEEEIIKCLEEGNETESYSDEDVAEEDSTIKLDNSLESLKILLSNKKPEPAAEMFLSLKDDGVEIPDAVTNQLIGLLAFYRASLNEVKQLEKYPNQSLYSWRMNRKQEVNLLHKVMGTIPSPTPEQLTACIRCHVLNYDFATACETYRKIPNQDSTQFNLESFNSVMLARLMLNINYSNCLGLLKEIRDAGYLPNRESFVNILTCRPTNSPEVLINFWAKVINEMDYLGIDVGLDAYVAMMNTADGLRITNKQKYQVQRAILEHMKGRWLDPDDPMNVAFVDKIHWKIAENPGCTALFWEIFTSGQNHKLLERSTKNYQITLGMLLSCFKTEGMEKVWSTLQQLVPMKLIMNDKTTALLIKAIFRNKRPEYLPVTYAMYLDKRMGMYSARSAWLDAANQLVDLADKDTKTQLAIVGTEIHFRLKECKSRIERLHLLNASLKLVANSGTVAQTAGLIETYLDKYSEYRIHEDTRAVCKNLLEKHPQSTALQKAVTDLEEKWKVGNESLQRNKRALSSDSSTDPYADDWWP
uniref:Pentatricopeptide repeat domain-containing protein 3, mitochondrial n=1 Tax=Phallusia mammillata TaxID=59560 RepID=A0A6F9DQJ1_9ASCI|nr:pentatricopeptide repeat domain-containing protein 3, mitochondrial [Phallusia mammillata]